MVKSREEVRRGLWSKLPSRFHPGENKLGNEPTPHAHSTDGPGTTRKSDHLCRCTFGGGGNKKKKKKKKKVVYPLFSL